MEKNIFKFRLKNNPTREQAKNWLLNHCDNWPDSMPEDISDDMFHGWRFVRSTDEFVYFANCIMKGITEQEFNECDDLANNK